MAVNLQTRDEQVWCSIATSGLRWRMGSSMHIAFRAETVGLFVIKINIENWVDDGLH